MEHETPLPETPPLYRPLNDCLPGPHLFRGWVFGANTSLQDPLSPYACRLWHWKHLLTVAAHRGRGSPSDLPLVVTSHGAGSRSDQFSRESSTLVNCPNPETLNP